MLTVEDTNGVKRCAAVMSALAYPGLAALPLAPPTGDLVSWLACPHFAFKDSSPHPPQILPHASPSQEALPGLPDSDATIVPVPVSHKKVLIIFSGLVLAMFLAALDSTIVATALPTIVGELGGLAHLSWVVTAYLLAQTIVTPLYGKLGDLYGRKRVLQSAILIFLAGSILCGLSQNLTHLIIFRAIQGVGGGGLLVTTQAVVADIVSPRDRGRYQGIFGAVFGLASIAGPLVGGFFTSHISWRWIFYINIPVGIIALVVIAATLPGVSVKVRHAIDYVGSSLLAITLSALVLLSDLGGVRFSWGSWEMQIMVAIAAVGFVTFIWAEHQAAEPVVPMHLFRNRVVNLTNSLGFVLGVVLFGAVTYMPLFLQVVKGETPTASGLQMVPMMGGMLLTSITSGQLISKTGRYKIFPLAGLTLVTIMLFSMSCMSVDTSIWTASLLLMGLGMGMGLVMQVLVIASQNAVAYKDIGVVTSAATLFRLVGGSIGTATLGAVFASRLTKHLAETLPPDQVHNVVAAGMTPSVLAQLPDATRAIYAEAFMQSLDTLFFVAASISVVGVVLAIILPELPLRKTVGE